MKGHTYQQGWLGMAEYLLEIYLHLINQNNPATRVDFDQIRLQHTMFGRL